MASHMTAPIHGNAAAYGRAFYSKPIASELNLEQKALLGHYSRARLNGVPVPVALMAPWVLFNICLAATAFHLRFAEPVLSAAIILVCCLGVLACIVKAYLDVKPKFVDGSMRREPTWWVFLAVSMAIALLCGCIFGGVIYHTFTYAYYNYDTMNSYGDINVAIMPGQQFMDAALLGFQNGTTIDLRKAMGYRNAGTMYCVAPLAKGGQLPPSYDFWVVGYDCCSVDVADYHCPNYNDQFASTGLRAIDVDDQAYFLKAVVQAEAAYALRVGTPIFMYWAVHADKMRDSFEAYGFKWFYIGSAAHFFWQCITVTVAAVAFSRMARGLGM